MSAGLRHLTVLMVVLDAARTTAAGQGTIHGVAYDSLLGAPLEGAEIFLRDAGRRVLADARGRFRFDGVAVGNHLLALAHPALDSAGLYTLTARVSIAARESAFVTLAVPSLGTFWRRACGGDLVSRADSGLVFGVLGDAESAARLAGATVVVSWSRLRQRGRTEWAVEPMEVRVRSDSVGAYYACGVASGVAVWLSGHAGRDSTGALEVRLFTRPVARRDLVISLTRAADSGAARPPAALRGTVSGPDGRPLASARVIVAGVGSTMTGERGEFFLGGLPGGTQWLRVLSAGLTPVEQAVDLRRGDTVSLSLALGAVPFTLDTIRVVAARRSPAMVEFDERRRQGFGYVVGEEDLAHLHNIRSAFFEVPNITVAGPSPYRFAVLLPSSHGECVATLFIDGLRASYEELAAYRPADLLGIEVYVRTSGLPARFQSVLGGCGVVLVWTKYVR